MLLLAVMVMCLVPLFMFEAARFALAKLHLSPLAATMLLFGIVFGGLVNLPVYVLQRDMVQPVPQQHVRTLSGWVPVVQRQPMRTIIALNVGGCLFPTGLAIYESTLVVDSAPWAAWALGMAVLVNVLVCYRVARPVEGLGIAMPGFVSPAVSVLVTWLLLMSEEYAAVRPPVAFTAGVLGPLIGADLLHLKDLRKLAAPMISIGGAGTFDGIVLSGLLAAFLA